MAGDGDAAPAGIMALRAFAKAPPHMVRAPDTHALLSGDSQIEMTQFLPTTIKSISTHHPSFPLPLSIRPTQTASSAAREGMCELAYPVREGTSEESSEKSLAQILDACAETLERLGTKMSGATAHDMTELAMLHTAAKTLVLRCRPDTTINPMWTNDRVSSNRGVLDTCWLTLLARTMRVRARAGHTKVRLF